MFSCKLWRSILAFYFKMIGINKSKKYYIFIENEEQFLQYLDSQKDSENMVFQNETNTDEDQIADILTYNKNTNNFQNLSPTKNTQCFVFFK